MKITELTDIARQFSRQLSEKYKDQGLKTLMMSMDVRSTEPTAELIEIWIDPKAQGTGVGSKVMQEITNWADKNNILLYLSLGEKDAARGTTSKERLRRFYKSFGFVDNKGRNKKYDLSMYANMYREPR